MADPACLALVQGPEAFAADVETEANRYFQNIYSEQQPIEEVS
jgi:hypothetical protein